MFTGIVEAVGRVASAPSPQDAALWVDAGALAERIRPGESLAVNGCCLTVTQREATSIRFDTLEETRRRTNLGRLAQGDLVNLERPILAGSRLDGHFVTGHIDGLSRLLEIRSAQTEHELWFERPQDWEKVIVSKGSVALDGISLTVGFAAEDRFSVWITPYTWRATNLQAKRPGDPVNVEIDILARYVAAHVGEAVPLRR